MRGGTYEYRVGLNATWYQKCHTLPSEFQSSLTFAVFLSIVIREFSGEGLSSQSGSTSASLSVVIAILFLGKSPLVFSVSIRVESVKYFWYSTL